LDSQTSWELFYKWLKSPEGRNLEFKEAKNSFSHEKELPDYCAALANEGGGKLILGVSDKRDICGTKAFLDNSNRLSHDLLQKLDIRVDVEELTVENKRVLIFHVPSRSVGLPVRSTGKYTYPMRAGESLVEMDSETLKKIFSETESDFSANIVKDLKIIDLDETAILNFRSRWA